MQEDRQNWDKSVDPVVCIVGGTSGLHRFPSFELLFGQMPQGVLDLIKENGERRLSTTKNKVQGLVITPN